MTRACRECLTRTWLLSRLSGHLDLLRAQIVPLLALPDPELLEAVGGEERRAIEGERATVDVRQLVDAACAQGIALICRCDDRYPARLHDLDAPPAVLHVAGRLERFLALAAHESVAVVGSRNASGYGLEMARSLARASAASGLTVVSGMARGIDTAAHQGALEAGSSPDAGTTIAVLPGPAERPYPAGQRGLYRQCSPRARPLASCPAARACAGGRSWPATASLPDWPASRWWSRPLNAPVRC